MQLCDLFLAGLFQRVVGGTVVVVRLLEQLVDVHVEPSEFPHRVVVERRFVEEVLVPVDEDSELEAPVAEVVVGDDGVVERAEDAGEGVADDGAAEVADVQRLGDVRAAHVDHEGLQLRSGFEAELRIGRDLVNGLGEEAGLNAEVDEPRPRDRRRFNQLVGRQRGDEVLRHVLRLLAECLAERHGEVRLVVAVVGVGGGLDHAEKIGQLRRIRRERTQHGFKQRTELVKQIHG